MKSLFGFILYLIIITIVTIPAYLGLRFSDIDMPLYAVVMISISHHISMTFILSAYTKAAKRDPFTYIDLSKWN
jgi:hypothetical protein|tara:strand:+ start:985 stop:1206 length:222 start_codon:yes stop_codon:yes gene_type:complete